MTTNKQLDKAFATLLPKPKLTATKDVHGNWEVSTESGLIVAVITFSELGWKVRTRTTARKSSRTYSTTPHEAAKKYFRAKVQFPAESTGAKLFTVVAVSDNTNAFGLKRVVLFGLVDGIPAAYSALTSEPKLGKRVYLTEARRIWECVESIPAPGTALFNAALREVGAEVA